MTNKKVKEIRIVIEDELILDLDGSECDNYEMEVLTQFKKTDLYQTLINDGFRYADKDFDDINFTMVFMKEEE